MWSTPRLLGRFFVGEEAFDYGQWVVSLKLLLAYAAAPWLGLRQAGIAPRHGLLFGAAFLLICHVPMPPPHEMIVVTREGLIAELFTAGLFYQALALGLLAVAAAEFPRLTPAAQRRTVRTRAPPAPGLVDVASSVTCPYPHCTASVMLCGTRSRA